MSPCCHPAVTREDPFRDNERCPGCGPRSPRERFLSPRQFRKVREEVCESELDAGLRRRKRLEMPATRAGRAISSLR